MTICAWKAQNYAIVSSCTELHYRLKYALGVVFLLIIASQKMNYDFSVAHKYRTKQTNLGGVWENKGSMALTLEWRLVAVPRGYNNYVRLTSIAL